MISKLLGRSIILLLLLTTQIQAQTPAATPPPPQPTPQPEDERKVQEELKPKALGLLEDVIKDSESFKHAENRIRVRALAAHVLWEHDETRARALFKEAITSLVNLLADQPEVSEQPGGMKMFEGSRQLRRELLQILAHRDPRLAREFLRATRSQHAQVTNSREALPDQPLEMSLAIQFAATDPKQALEIGEESLARGLTYELPQLIRALRHKDSDAAARLAGQVISKLRTEKLDSSHVAREVAVALLREATQAPSGEGKSAAGATPLLEQAALRELTEMIAAEALRPSSTSPELLVSLQEMMPVLEKHAPARAAQLRRKMEPQKEANEEGGRTAGMEDWHKYQAVMEKGNVEELLTAAATAPEGVREMLYHQVSTKIMAEGGDADRARQVINERVKDPALRKQLLMQVDEMAAYKAAEQGKIEQTRKMLATLRTNEERVMVLAQLATGAAARGDKKAALQLLEEARGMVGGRAKNFTQLGAQLAVARAYAPLDTARSLAILEPVVDQLNELLAAAIVLGGFITEELIRDDEIMMEPLAMVSNEIFFRYMGDLKALARADFDRTSALAERFQRDEIRIIARLLVAQSILLPQPTPHPEMQMAPISTRTVVESSQP